MKETEPEESPSKEGSAASIRQHSETLGPTDATEITAFNRRDTRAPTEIERLIYVMSPDFKVARNSSSTAAKEPKLYDRPAYKAPIKLTISIYQKVDFDKQKHYSIYKLRRSLIFSFGR